MITRHIHQVDLGQWGALQHALGEHVRRLHPGWSYTLWRRSEVEARPVRGLLDEMLRRGRISQASDLAAIEVVASHGGIYVDPNMYVIRPFDDIADGADAFLAWQRYDTVTNRIFGARRHHQLGHALMTELPLQVNEKLALEREWECCGTYLFDRVGLKPEIRRSVPILPPAYFFPHWDDIATRVAELPRGTTPDFVFAAHLGDDATWENLSRAADRLGTTLTDPLTPHASNGNRASMGASVALRPPSVPNRTECVRLDSNGIGDLMVAACAVAGIRAERPATRIVLGVRPHLVPWALLLEEPDIVAECDVLPECDVVFAPYASYGLREIPEQGRRLRHEYYSEVCGVVPVMPKLTLSAEDRHWAGTVEGFGSRTAIIAPFAAFGIRSWPANFYGDLIDVLRANGVSPIVIDGPGDGSRTAAFGTWRYWGQSPGQLAALLARADLVIANDSGVAHLSGTLGTPTLVLCGSTSGASVFGFYPSVQVIQSSKGCSPCYWQPARGYRIACDLGCEALYEIKVFDVLARALAILSSRDDRPHG